MIDPRSELSSVEARLKALEKPVPEFAREAGIHPSTWRRWRNGETEPNFSTWRKIQAELSKLEDSKRTLAPAE